MIETAALKLRQADAAKGRYAEAMAGYIRWMAPQLDEVRSDMEDSIPGLRDRLHEEGDHGRTPEIQAHLLYGAKTFLKYALEVGAIDKDEHDAHVKNFLRGLAKATREIRADRAEQPDPCMLFLTLVAAALSSGKAYLGRRDNDQAPIGLESLCGWRQVYYSWVTWPNSERIGWVEEGTVMLHPQNSFAMVRKLADAGGQGFAVSRETLCKMLRDAGLIDLTKGSGRNRGGKQRTTGQVYIGTLKRQIEVLTIPTRHFWGDGDDEPTEK